MAELIDDDPFDALTPEERAEMQRNFDTFKAEWEAGRDWIRRRPEIEQRLASLEATDGAGCPCRHTTPCHPRCTCTMPASSRGCRRCCRYGSKKQQAAQARYLASLVPPAKSPQP